jgi:serine/threonine-protein kinase
MTKILEENEIVEFDAKKQFIYIDKLGKGGTGDTRLFKDDRTDMFFAFKKYKPFDEKYKKEFYKRFIDEIKILFNISHLNIVRIFNYYLYDESYSGYLQMEYIKGVSIDKYDPLPWDEDWNSIFKQALNAFEYLEENKILHRDIRPQNILIADGGKVKIIDFGFGKLINSDCIDENSILLNWPVTENPEEIIEYGEYTHSTEIYFLGKLFKKILDEKKVDFTFTKILQKMIKVNRAERYESFSQIIRELSVGALDEFEFNDNDKNIYLKFADGMYSMISSYTNEYTTITDIDIIRKRLFNVIKINSLEKYIQSNSELIQCFITSGFTYWKKISLEVNILKEFYKLLDSSSQEKQKIIIDNLYNRISKIKINKDTSDDELPF